MPKRTLIITLPPIAVGGVTAKARLLAGQLSSVGHEVTVAYYSPRRGMSTAASDMFGGARLVSVPCRFPWLEQAYTAGSTRWRQLIDNHDRHVAVGGTVLVANPLVAAGVRHMVWCAADLAGDRDFRRHAMPWWRRGGDALLVAPFLARQQARVLAGDNRIYGVSLDTVARLWELAPTRHSDIERLPIPVDIDFFRPSDRAAIAFRLGFAGRLDDPRKNPALLFGLLAILRQRGIEATLAVTGEATPWLLAHADACGVREHVIFAGVLAPDGLRRFYQALDVFVITSFQEGLAIAGLEAMACGVPVVATDCGGPADYIVDGDNGALCGFGADELADAIVRVCDSATRPAISDGARRTVEARYGLLAFEQNLAKAWRAVWGEAL